MDRTAQDDAFLRDEYLLLQNQYEDYDRRSLTIKGWFSGGAVAAMGVALGAKLSIGMSILAAIAVVALVFWYLEACWKTFQYSLIDRIETIETHFRRDPNIQAESPQPFQTFGWWKRSYRVQKENLYQAAGQPFVCLPYVAFIALSVVGTVVLAMTTSAPCDCHVKI